MIDLHTDLERVFFGPDFTTPFLCTRGGQPPFPVAGIFGVVDEERLDGRVLAAVRELRLSAAHELRPDDVLEAQQAVPELGVALGAQFVVLEAPQRTTDGAEQIVLLGSHQP